MYYEGHSGDNTKFEKRASGAYIFRPSDDNVAVKLNPVGELKTYDRPLFVEIHQEFEMGVSQVIRVPTPDAGELFDVEVEWMVGPISIQDGKGKEFVHRIR